MQNTKLLFCSAEGNIADTIVNLFPKQINIRQLPLSIFEDASLYQEHEEKILKSDVIILNLSSGIQEMKECIAKIKKDLPEIPLIVLHHYTQKVFAKAFIQMGAKAYLPVNFDKEELLLAIEQVQENKIFISRHLS